MDRTWTFAVCALAFAGCTEAREDVDATPPMTTASASAEGTAGDGEGSSTTMVEEEDDIKLDLGMDTDGADSGVDPDGDDESGCDKVDFLFVIDNSGSMGPYQEDLVTNFPGFINTIQQTLDEAQDYHILVTHTQPGQPVDCEQVCQTAEDNMCLDANGACNLFACPFVCIDYPACGQAPGGCEDPLPPDPCDIMGSGVTFPRGQDASNMDCDFSTGARYMDTSEPNLQAAFSCAARVGTSGAGGPEMPMGAMVQAVTDGTPAKACNEGFLRDDAILVVTFITDEDDSAVDDDGGSDGTVETWRNALIAAKNGDPEAVVMLGLFGGGGCGEDSVRLTEFVDSWGERGLQGSVCGNYQGFFLDAVGLIDNTCDEFVPPKPVG